MEGGLLQELYNSGDYQQVVEIYREQYSVKLLNSDLRLEDVKIYSMITHSLYETGDEKNAFLLADKFVLRGVTSQKSFQQIIYAVWIKVLLSRGRYLKILSYKEFILSRRIIKSETLHLFKMAIQISLEYHKKLFRYTTFGLLAVCFVLSSIDQELTSVDLLPLPFNFIIYALGLLVGMLFVIVSVMGFFKVDLLKEPINKLAKTFYKH